MTSQSPFSRLSAKQLTTASLYPSQQSYSKALNPSFTYITSGNETRAAVQMLMQLELCGLDIETTNLDPRQAELRLIQLGTDEHVFVFDVRRIGADIKILSKIISNPKIAKIGQNLTFEWQWCEFHGMPLRGNLIDTFIAGRILSLGKKNLSNSLGALVERYLGQKLEDKDEGQASFIDYFDDDFNEWQLNYGARDVSILFPLYRAQKLKLRENDLTHMSRFECRALHAFASMIFNGFLLDVDYYDQLLKDKQKLRDEKQADLIDKFVKAGVLDQYINPETNKVLLHPDYYGKSKTKPQVKGFNINSVQQLKPVLKAFGVPVEESLNKNALAWLRPDHQIIHEYLNYKELVTACTQVEGLRDHALTQKDHRIHAGYKQLGCDTGRVSCSEPNLQNVKRDAEYRRGFIAAPGNVLVIADYSQLELRIAAECSGDQIMRSAYREGADFHTKTAALMNGIDEESVTKEQRRDAKTYNFGALFGSGAKSIRQQAAGDGLFLTLDEAQTKLDQWKSAFPQLIAWQAEQGNKSGAIYTLMGRRRLVTQSSDRYTTRLNTQVQGSGGDCMKAALILLWEKYLSVNNEWKLVANVHDEVVLEVPEQDKDEAQIVLKECMESAAYEVMLVEVPIVAEPGYGNDWSAK